MERARCSPRPLGFVLPSGAHTTRIGVLPPEAQQARGRRWLYKAEATGDGQGCQTPGTIWLVSMVTQTFSLGSGSYPLAVRLNHILKTSSLTGTRNAKTQEW